MKYKKLCLQMTYPNKDGQPDLDKGKLCIEWATIKWQHKGKKEVSYYCDKHNPINYI